MKRKLEMALLWFAFGVWFVAGLIYGLFKKKDTYGDNHH